MSRAIEFRVYSTVTGSFDYFTIKDLLTNECRKVSEKAFDEDLSVEQFTGLHDCNGVKIFEGDTVKAPCGHVGHVIFSGASFSVEDYDSGDYYQGQNPDSWDWSKFDVISNIHQNSEQLK